MTTSHRLGGPVATLLALVAGLTGCSADNGSGDGPPSAVAGSSAAVSGSAPTLSTATLADDVNAATGTWSTTWQACFIPAAEKSVAGWEVQTLTSEGAAPGVEQLDGECLGLQVATGVGDPGTDPTRAIGLADAARLVYQVRAVRADGSVTPWSEPVAAGSER